MLKTLLKKRQWGNEKLQDVPWAHYTYVLKGVNKLKTIYGYYLSKFKYLK